MLAVLSLGSNMPYTQEPAKILAPHEILRAACGCLSEKLRDFRVSSIYRTKPLYYEQQDDFYNLVCAGEWNAIHGGALRDARGLLRWTQSIEARFGRDRTREIPKGPRTLDIDIALLGNMIVNASDITIPHPGIKERAFVLVPLLEILGESADIISRKTYRSALDDLTVRGVELFDEYGNRI